MKKLLFLLIALAFVACEKENYCASCVEKNSGYEPVDFCGSGEEVDVYIDGLYEMGVLIGQDWECTKVID